MGFAVCKKCKGTNFKLLTSQNYVSVICNHCLKEIAPKNPYDEVLGFFLSDDFDFVED